MRIWRISEHADLSGRGGELYAARWNHAGDAIVYCADHPSTAMLEILVNADPEDLPGSYQLLEIELPDELEIETAKLAGDWQDDQSVSRRFWRAFQLERRTPVLCVPSVVMPRARNFLVNPRLEACARIVIVSATRFSIDPRFLR